MVKHTHTIHWLPTNYFSVFYHFVLKGLIINFSSLKRMTVKKYLEEADPLIVSRVYMFPSRNYSYDIDKKISTCY